MPHASPRPLADRTRCVPSPAPGTWPSSTSRMPWRKPYFPGWDDPMPLDPGAVAVLNLIKELGRPPIQDLSPAEAREATAKSRAVLQPEPEEVAELEDLACPGPHGPIKLRRYRGAGTGADEALPCLLYLHGGGWVIGDLDSHDQPCRVLANAARCCVIAVDYRMAPEYVYPA